MVPEKIPPSWAEATGASNGDRHGCLLLSSSGGSHLKDRGTKIGHIFIKTAGNISFFDSKFPTQHQVLTTIFTFCSEDWQGLGLGGGSRSSK